MAAAGEGRRERERERETGRLRQGRGGGALRICLSSFRDSDRISFFHLLTWAVRRQVPGEVRVRAGIVARRWQNDEWWEGRPAQPLSVQRDVRADDLLARIWRMEHRNRSMLHGRPPEQHGGTDGWW